MPEAVHAIDPHPAVAVEKIAKEVEVVEEIAKETSAEQNPLGEDELGIKMKTRINFLRLVYNRIWAAGQ